MTHTVTFTIPDELYQACADRMGPGTDMKLILERQMFQFLASVMVNDIMVAPTATLPEPAKVLILRLKALFQITAVHGTNP